jgi:opacity protein-like surface antigen
MVRFPSIALASVLLAFGVSVALGAELDQPVPKAPHLPIFDWTGFYFGIHGGYGLGHDPFSDNLIIANLTFTGVESRGAVYGLHAGYNWQYRSLVFGFETDLSATQIRGTTPTQSFADPAGDMASGSVQDRFNYLGSLRARAGYSPSPNLLLYATGGPAWAHTTQTTNTSVTNVVPLLSSFTIAETFSGISDRFGVAVGAGAEVRFSAFAFPLIGRLEYLHYDFGNQNTDVRNDTICNGNTCGTFTAFNKSGRLTTDVVRAGVSIQFK